MLTVFAFAGLFTLVVLSLSYVLEAGEAQDDLAYRERLERMYDRDEELLEAYLSLQDQLGHPPSTRELWAYSPPNFPVDEE